MTSTESQPATAAPWPQGLLPIKALVVSFPPGKGGLGPAHVAQILGALDDTKMNQGGLGFKPGVTTHDDKIRTGQVQWVHHSQVDRAIFRHLFTLAMVTNREQGWSFEVDGIGQHLQATRYADTGQHYDWHLDWGGGRTQFRKITLIVHLSQPEEFTGGVLQVTNGALPLETTPPAGTVTIFPSFMLHRVTPVTAGVRSAAVSWMMGPSFR